MFVVQQAAGGNVRQDGATAWSNQARAAYGNQFVGQQRHRARPLGCFAQTVSYREMHVLVPKIDFSIRGRDLHIHRGCFVLKALQSRHQPLHCETWRAAQQYAHLLPPAQATGGLPDERQRLLTSGHISVAFGCEHHATGLTLKK